MILIPVKIYQNHIFTKLHYQNSLQITHENEAFSTYQNKAPAELKQYSEQQ